jgi:hypothetical protein
MSEHYSHLLIPVHPDCVPLPAQVTAFLEGLTNFGSAPLNAAIKISKLSGKVRTGRNSFTGETVTIPGREHFALQSLDAIPEGLQRLEDYTVSLSGEGPVKNRPFGVYLPSDPEWQSEIETAQYYEVSCNLRESTVSMSEGSWMKPCTLERGEGVFRNPWNNETVQVQNAACARFWIEFTFGNWLVPRIERSLDLLPPEILSLATGSFGVGFAQGCQFS